MPWGSTTRCALCSSGQRRRRRHPILLLRPRISLKTVNTLSVSRFLPIPSNASAAAQASALSSAHPSALVSNAASPIVSSTSLLHLSAAAAPSPASALFQLMHHVKNPDAAKSTDPAEGAVEKVMGLPVSTSLSGHPFVLCDRRHWKLHCLQCEL